MMKELIGQYINLSYLKYFGILANGATIEKNED